MKQISRILTLLFLVVAAFSGAVAQTSNGTLVGTVTDTSGGAVAGARVLIQSLDTGQSRTTLTIANGSYRVESLLPGKYTVSVKTAGYAESVVKGVVVPGSVITTTDVVLKVGGASEQVEVSAENAGINTDNAQLSGSIGSEEISTLPISSLSAYSLALTLPGVTTAEQAGFSNGVNYAVGGGRPRANNFLIEGQDNNDAGLQGQGLQPANIEAQKEVIIIENNYTSEYGHGAGSVSNLIFKSGTNQLHGSLYERLKNSSLDSTDHYQVRNEIEKTKYRENLYGFTIGGPVVKNKIFGFGSYQWDPYRASASLDTLVVPSANGYATLNALGTNSRVATLIEAYGGLVGNHDQLVKAGGTDQVALGRDPITGLDRDSVELGQVTRNLGAQSDAPELDLKGDYLINKNDTLTLRYIRSRFTAPYDIWNSPGQMPGFDTDQDGTAHNGGIVETHIFSPAVVNEFRLSYGRIGFTFGLPASTTSNPLFGTPYTSITSLSDWGVPTNTPQGRFHNTYQLQDSLSWTHGKHFVKFGFDLANIRVSDQVPFNIWGSIGYASVAGGYTGLANYIDNYGGTSAAINQNFGNSRANPNIWSQNYFAQDTWKATQNLSVDFGFRYEYNGAPFNAHGTPYPAIDYSDPTCFPTDGVTCNTSQKADGTEWGPRVGLAYSPKLFSNYTSVIRAGFGMFYDVLFTNIIDNIQASAPNAAAPNITSSVTPTTPRGTPAWSDNFASLIKTPQPTDIAEPIYNHLLMPRTFHWNLNVQQDLPGNFSLMAAYVGERGEHLFGTTEFNPYIDYWNSAFFGAPLDRRLPSRGRILVRDNSEDSNYNGLWAQLDHTLRHGLILRASYTYAKAMDDGSEIFTTNNQSTYASASYPAARKDIDMGLSAYDHRQRLALTYVWAPPLWHTTGGMKVLGNVANHWTISGITSFQSGTPMNVESGYDSNGDGITNDRPILGNPKAPLQTYAWDDAWWYGVSSGTYCSGPSFYYTNLPCEPVSKDSVHWIIPAFDSRPLKTIGRNSLISPGYQNWDMSIQRSFPLWREGTSLDFRSEFFNIFNHGNASDTTDASLGNSTLVSGINTDAWSNNGTNTFYEFAPTVGGHRNIRFYVKISF